MKISSHENTLAVFGLTKLTAENAAEVRNKIRAELKTHHGLLKIDFSGIEFLDSSGLGVLIALQQTICEQNGRIQIHHPNPTSQQILELTRLHRIFELILPPNEES